MSKLVETWADSLDCIRFVPDSTASHVLPLGLDFSFHGPTTEEKHHDAFRSEKGKYWSYQA